LVDISTNVPDTDGLKVDHTRREYFNVVRYPSDGASDSVVGLAFLAAILANSTLLGLILDETS
jgi:hypothetical protein